MATNSDNLSLLEWFAKLVRLPWYVITAIIAGVLLALLILVAYIEGSFTDGIDWSFWRLGLQPAIIVYIFVLMPLIQRLWNRALQSLQLLLPQAQKLEITKKVSRYNRRWEWVALFLGAAFFIALGQPWSWDMKWGDIYVLVTSITMFSLLGLLIYGGLSSTLRLAQLNRHYLKIDIFDTKLLTPIAYWSLSVSLAFVGGISLSVVFQPLENLRETQNIIIYSILTCVTVLLFFISMWSTHNAMALAKKRELTIVRENLGDARRQLMQLSKEDMTSSADKLYSAIAVWGIYERQVREAPTWPFNAGILGRLIASALAPAIIYIIKIFSGLGFRP
jgi:hypothetical protein